MINFSRNLHYIGKIRKVQWWQRERLWLIGYLACLKAVYRPLSVAYDACDAFFNEDDTCPYVMDVKGIVNESVCEAEVVTHSEIARVCTRLSDCEADIEHNTQFIVVAVLDFLGV